MKNIDQQAIDYAQKWYTEESEYLIARLGFKAGVEFAEQFISTDDETPDLDTTVIVKITNNGVEEERTATLRNVQYWNKARGNYIEMVWNVHGFCAGIFFDEIKEWRPLNRK